MDYQHLALQRDASMPLYRQIAALLIAAMKSGELHPAERLPSIRALAQTLGVSQVTITQTYDVLTAEGYVASHVGRGTFVLPHSQEVAGNVEPLPASSATLAKQSPGTWVASWQASRPQTPRRQWHIFMQEVMRRLSQADAPIYLSNGIPDPKLFPVQRWQRSMQLGAQSLAQDHAKGDDAAFQYDDILGDATLRTYLAGAMAKYGIHVAPDEILLISGTQQGLDLSARTFMTPNDLVFVEELTYLSALDLFEHMGATLQPVPMDDQGMRVDLLAQQIGDAQSHPRLVYSIPTGHNPTGITMSEERRGQLVQLAQERNLLLIDDMAFDELFLDGVAPPPLAHFDHDGRVISLISFNKTVFPALRMGCIIAARPLVELLAGTKEIVDHGASLPLARALWRHLDSPAYQRELQTFRQHYRAQRDHLLQMLERDLRPLGCHWTHPQAGFSLMVTLPGEWDALHVVMEAASQGLLILPGQQFAPTPGSTWANSLRLIYGNLSTAQLDEAMRRLVQILRQARQPGARENPLRHIPPHV